MAGSTKTLCHNFLLYKKTKSESVTDNGEFRIFIFWWRWRESNSRPKSSCQGFYECSLSFKIPFTYRRQTACKLRYSLLPDESRENQSFMFAAKSTLCPQARQSAGERKLLITQQEQLNYFCQLILSCYF